MGKQRTTKVKCTGLGTSTAKSGTPQLVYDLTVLEPSAPHKTGDTIKFWQPVTDKTLDFVKEQLRNMGMTNDDFTQPEGLGRLAVKVVEEFQTYQGNESWRPRYINPIKERATLDEDTAEELQAMIMSALQGTEVVEATELNTAPDTVEAPPEDDF